MAGIRFSNPASLSFPTPPRRPAIPASPGHVVSVAVRRVSTSLRRSSSPDAAVPSGEDSLPFPFLPRFPVRRRRPRSPSPSVAAAVRRRLRDAFAPSPPPPDAVAGNATRACRRR
uniref:Uncharacterized protein n=1 Tax=Oryza sativa subsp. japonica TaxID=39947 RepID=Q8LNS2_ORYSJ|nr:hypothetical protein [Oryza sativa Japonica Group]